MGQKMQLKSRYFISIITIGLFAYMAVLGQIQSPRPENWDFLATHDNRALININKIYLSIRPMPFIPLHADPNEYGLIPEQLRARIENELRQADIRVEAEKAIAGEQSKVLIKRLENQNIEMRNLVFKSAKIPELRVFIEILKLNDSQQHIFFVQTSLSRAVNLAEPKWISAFKTDVWKTDPVIKLVTLQNIPVEITEVALEQVEAFIEAYRQVNPSSNQPLDADDFQTSHQKQVGSANKSAVVEYKYIASRKSEVFHRPDCRWAERISPENLVVYASRDEAIKDGKRPCKSCKP
jgi:hypothetical protein